MKQNKVKLGVVLTALSLTALTACNKTADTLEEPAQPVIVETVTVNTTSTETPVAVDIVSLSEAEEGKPAMSASSTELITALVKDIDHETRVVTLLGPEGNLVTFTASEEARNLDQVKAGDMVTAEYTETVSIEVVATEDAEAAAAAVAGIARSEKGEMPGLAAVTTEVELLVVEDINIEANTFKLKDVSGAVTEYVALNPDNLKRSEVGDTVVISITEAVAISVAKAASM